jgi:hypothetical protein
MNAEDTSGVVHVVWRRYVGGFQTRCGTYLDHPDGVSELKKTLASMLRRETANPATCLSGLVIVP